MRGEARVRYYVGRGGVRLFVSTPGGLEGEGRAPACSRRGRRRPRRRMSWSGSTLHSHRHGEVKQSWPSRPGARAASQRASPGGTELLRGAVSRAVGGRRERACVLSVQQVCCIACWQAVQMWLDGGARARRPPRAACRRARLARWSCVVPGAARSGRAWCLKQCAGAWQRAWTVNEVHCGARVAA